MRPFINQELFTTFSLFSPSHLAAIFDFISLDLKPQVLCLSRILLLNHCPLSYGKYGIVGVTQGTDNKEMKMIKSWQFLGVEGTSHAGT